MDKILIPLLKHIKWLVVKPVLVFKYNTRIHYEEREMYELHYYPGTASLVVHWLLIEMELPHRLRLVDFEKNEQKSPEYLAINPSGLVPSLVINGKPMAEFGAIAMYLADRHDELGLAPAVNAPLRAEYNQWMFFISNTVQPTFRLWFYPQDLVADETQIVATIQSRIEGYFERIDKHFSDGRKYVLGEHRSTVDFLLTMIMRWSRNMPKPADHWPHLASYARRMKSLESFKEVYLREGITDWV